MEPCLHLLCLRYASQTWLERAGLNKPLRALPFILVVCMRVSTADQEYVAFLKRDILMLRYGQQVVEGNGMRTERIISFVLPQLPSVIIQEDAAPNNAMI